MTERPKRSRLKVERAQWVDIFLTSKKRGPVAMKRVPAWLTLTSSDRWQVELLGQILQDKSESFWENPDLRLCVRDERNNVHLRIAVSGTLISGFDSDYLGSLASALREIEGQ